MIPSMDPGMPAQVVAEVLIRSRCLPRKTLTAGVVNLPKRSKKHGGRLILQRLAALLGINSTVHWNPSRGIRFKIPAERSENLLQHS